MKKILLLSDVPPCSNFTAGLVLDRLVRFLPVDQIAICTIGNRDLKFAIPKELELIPHLALKKPYENGIKIPAKLASILNSRIFTKLVSSINFVLEIWRSLQVQYCLLPEINDFIKEQKIDVLWVILQGQTMVRLASHLSKKSGLPLFTQVWDPFEWWLRANKIDRYTTRKLLKTFDEVIKNSVSCATASWAMSDNYSTVYGVKNLPVIASLPREFAKNPADKPHTRDEFIIAMAGQLYAQAEWNALIKSLNKAKWYIAGKNIRLRVMGAGFQYYADAPANIEYLGWRSQEEVISLLSESDLLYMPYWFSEEFRLEAVNSFPGKLVSYLASGRPVFCHAPDYSSPAQYIAKNNAGYLCNSLDHQVIIQSLENAIVSNDSYARIAKNGTECFLRDFTLEAMKKSFFDFLQMSE